MRYRLFGLTVDTDRPLPTLSPDPVYGPADVRMWIGAHPPGIPAIETPWHVAERESAHGGPVLRATRSADGAWLCLRYADGTVITVDRDAARVGCTWPAPLSIHDAATYLLGPVCGLLLRLRGVTALHASAVGVGGHAILMVGPPGAGKSTTAAALVRRGHRLLADDVAALDERGGRVWARPAYPQLKLWPDAARALRGDDDLPALTPGTPAWDKRYLDLSAGDAFQRTPLPVSAVFVLAGREMDGAPRLETVDGPQALLTLVANTYLGWLPDAAAQGRALALFGRMARQVPVIRAVPHGDAARLDELCAMIERRVPVDGGAGDDGEER